ncbi:hypothetical protein EI94DRAFT_1742544 [Lactarius quietus]|nr:hypothetical protein EI94DRAFT_1742544 [Lactarius quietus]
MYPTWKNRGCYSDTNPNRSVRTLSTEVTVPGGLANASVENCIGECISLHFTIAGMEGETCWCDIEFSAGTTLPISDCFTPCTGDHTEYCGTNGALLLYYDE